MSRLALALAALALACTDPPSRVFVPAASFSESIRTWTEQGESATLRVGEPLALHGERRSGPWLEVDRATLAADACWWASATTFEEEVAGELKWTADPAGPASFNVDLKLDGSREVRFSEPGTYTLTPESSGWCGPPYTGNVLRIEVTPR